MFGQRFDQSPFPRVTGPFHIVAASTHGEGSCRVDNETTFNSLAARWRNAVDRERTEIHGLFLMSAAGWTLRELYESSATPVNEPFISPLITRPVMNQQNHGLFPRKFTSLPPRPAIHLFFNRNEPRVKSSFSTIYRLSKLIHGINFKSGLETN